MSAVGPILLQSPGCNEGKARYGTLGTHGKKQNELRQGAALTGRVFVLWCCGSLKKCRPYGAQEMCGNN